VKKLYIDVETRSRVELGDAGSRRYAVDPSTMVTTAAWKWAAPKGAFSPAMTACNVPSLAGMGRASMAEFTKALGEADTIVAHHINFDVNVIAKTLGPCGMRLEQFDCTMARAQRMSLPGGLEELCRALGVQGKTIGGRRFVMATCKPKRDGSWNEDPEVFRHLIDYNAQDIHCLESVDEILPPLPPEELAIWRRTWWKNARGLPLDLELCHRIAAKKAEIEREIAGELFEITGGTVTALTQRARILTWLKTQGVDIGNTQRATLETWLDLETLPFNAWRILTYLFESGGSAPTKAQALLDRQVNGLFQDATRYFGARSGRGTSEGVNMFNIARPSGKYDTETVIARLKAEPNGVFTNTELSDVLRGAIVAPAGDVVIDADLSNIELRLSLWFAGDQAKLDLLAKGDDLYAKTAGNSMGVSGLTKYTHPKERQAYKKVVLSGGYGIGIDKLFRTFKVDKDLPYEYRRDITLDQVSAIHRGYRADNVPLQKAWYALGDAMKLALRERGRVIEVCGGKIAFLYRGAEDVLALRLPSGRVIPHYKPHLDEEGQLCFWRAKYGRMMKCRTWGGAIMEIACQSAARDVLVAVEAAIEQELPDVRLILDIYDSVVALAPKAVAQQRLDHILTIMRRTPAWAVGLPLNAEGMIAARMQK
jgi:hypothetical protein